jgi:hypothetical protein
MSDSIAPALDELKAFLAAFNLNRFGVGRHIIRDERGWKVGEMNVESMWLATIQPSFNRTAYFMVMHTEVQPRALFCFRGVDSQPIIKAGAVECPGLDDRVCASLKHIDLFPRGTQLVLDGICYKLYVRTGAVSADLSFATPKSESLRGVEKALFTVAKSVARITADESMSDYLKIWGKYVK